MEPETDDAAGKEFAVKTAIGEIKTKGYHLGNLLQILGAMLLALMAYMLWETRVDNKDAARVLAVETKAEAVQRNQEHKMLEHAIERGINAQEEASYILTLSAEDRTRLRLDMPASLRGKVNTR